MDNNNNRTATVTLSGGTLGFITFIVFLILKLTGTWDIDWFWVWFPLWLPCAIGALLIVVAIICGLIASKMED